MQSTIPKDDQPGQTVTPLILLFLLLSGSCGLVYEILWVKMLTLVIGNTVFSITTVLTAFMGGLALGSYLAGRFSTGLTSPLKAYGLLEGGIGLYALVLPLLIAGTEPFFRFVYQELNPSFYTFSLLRFVVCGILLLIPTTLMGATLPVLSQYFIAGKTRLGRGVGLLYGVNTFGAVLGCSLAGFVLIPALGVTWTIYGAALLNLAIGAGVWILAKKPATRPTLPGGGTKTRGQKHKKLPKKGPPAGQTPSRETQDIFPEIRPAAVRVIMGGIGLSGLAAMIYQIAWTRVITLSIGSSVYAFSLIVTAFICGLALGSLIIAGFIDRHRNLILWLSITQAAVGISALAMTPLLGRLPVFFAETVFSTSHSFQFIHLFEFVVIFGLILIPTLMMGAAVPMAVKICTPDAGRVARFFGNVYAFNTLGAIFGSFIAGFLLIPWLNTQNSILVAVALNILAAVMVLLQVPGISAAGRIGGALAIVAAAALVFLPLPQWNAVILSSGPYLYTDNYRDTSTKKGVDLGSAMQAGKRLVYVKEGLHALVSVEASAHGELSLKVNGKTDASAKGGDVATQLMVAHLPLLLHPDARDVLVIGLGSGMTLSAVERHPVKAVDVVEIEDAVVEASRYFDQFTGSPLDDGRVNLIVADGRNHMALTDRRYDVIISEPSNPWVAGMANLFSREYFALAKGRLRPDGLMCQWVHAYSMSPIDFKTVVHTFQTVFPNSTVWEAGFGNDYLLVGFPPNWQIDPRVVIDRLGDKRLNAHLEKMHIRGPAAFINKLIVTNAAMASYTDGAPLHSDGNARLEYSAPKGLVRGRSPRLMEELYRYRTNPADMLASLQWGTIDSRVKQDLAMLFQAKSEVLHGFVISLSNGVTQDALKRFEKALAIHPGDYNGTFMLAQAYFDLASSYEDAQRLAEAFGAYQKCAAAIDNFLGSDRGALSDHLWLDMIYSKANLQLGTLALKANHLEEAAASFEKSLSGDVRLPEAYNNLGIVNERAGRYEAAVDQYRNAIDLEPTLVSAHMNMGNALLKQKKYEQAIDRYQRIKALKPDFALTNYNLGMAYFGQAQWEKAAAEWERALALKPDFDQARQGLKVVRQKIGSP